MPRQTGPIDPNRPWIADPRDNPGDMNWVQTLLNPLGETSKLHFSRAWTFMFVGRLALFFIPSLTLAVLGIAGFDTRALNPSLDLLLISVQAWLLPFAVFTLLTEFTSFVAHLRRFNETGRPPALAAIVLAPLIIGLVAFIGGAMLGAAQWRAGQAPPAAVASETGEAARPEAAAQRSEGRRQRGGPPGRPSEPMGERDMARATGTGLGLIVWGLTSFGVMIWTLVYVARLPNGGAGRLRTGSHLTPDQVAGAA